MRIYLDNAATSWPKRPGVAEAVARAIELGSSYGRGQSRASDEVRRTVDRCRTRAAALFSVKDSSRVIFTAGGTDALHLAIGGLISSGDRVVTTVMEHNSVLRPLYNACERLGITLELVPADAKGYVDVDAFAAACEKPTQLAIITHASNVTGAVQDVVAMAQSAREAGATVVLDACQTAGHVPVDLAALGVDILATSGHKGLGGSLGTGLMVLADDCRQWPQPVRLGGTGSSSESPVPPETLPARYEAGSLNVPGIFGLDAALETLTITESHHAWVAELASIPGVTLVGPGVDEPRVNVASVTIDGWSPHDFAAVLESEFQIETRAGLHCSPRAHESLGTLASGGTVRFSPPESESEWPWLEFVRQVAGA